MKRKDYKRPTMKVVKLQPTRMIQTSGGDLKSVSIRSYTRRVFDEE